ncbi:LmeA family phospholipid-binding protein [Amycolatopsis sp. QT-25]|uniref:LmeA family phospholipid-binding protein n=1 Tax=Amycolatopsis sp. QT-25 TaxID=3034022 RepID=UPI0023ED81F7|nr:LmeA family phospholipid-binding protein [Amycolatopsis sp. QT-25]WET81118.1 LmeA family phospholipid-binding protein [Amycolatopsis sp. QT-25]
MSDGRWFDLNPLPELFGLAAAGRALLPIVPVTPAAVLKTVTEQLVGRRLTTKVNGHDVGLTLTALDYQADSLSLAATGRIGDVRLVADDVDWPETPLERITVLASNVRLRSLPSPAAIPEQVRMAIRVSPEVLQTRVAETRPGIIVTPGDDGHFHVRWEKRPHWGHLALEPTVEGDAVVLRPMSVHIGRRRFGPPSRLKPIMLPLPDLPRGIRLTAVESHDGHLVLHALAEEWPERLSTIPLGDLLGWVTTAVTTLTLPGLGGR